MCGSTLWEGLQANNKAQDEISPEYQHKLTPSMKKDFTAVVAVQHLWNQKSFVTL